ncbi:interleukin-6 receptor subunit alpha isoform X1 [Thunnus albacares]|uniref:interleukin-6 receptor subunit alpha isoform X1 n=1 Tax=Thunnus albacares TaxID=8236 RepID=UPI001CF6EA45|nr:interleukin-6 receptor subunit alpha isoform X1 [Thunnus albacares]
MRIFLPLLCILCATPVHNFLDGTCLRKEPPPGVLVLSSGTKLDLTCSGLVKVNGVKVSITRKSSNINRRSSDATPVTANIITNTTVSVKSDASVNTGYHTHPAEAVVNTVTGENRRVGYTDTGYTAYPTSQPVQPTSVSRVLTGESHREAEDMDDEGDYEEEEEEGEEGSRVTRGIKSRPQWKWNGRTVGKGDRDWGEVTFERTGATLSMASVRPKDSGNYTCHHRGRDRFSLKVAVADPPETPSLSCYKKSPSSKIRCDWTPQMPVTKRLNCHLLLRKGPSETFLPLQCSYSSRCWCALDHNEDELRTLHMAYLCVTNIAGNATSTVLTFTPLDILKPDPPSRVSVRQEEGEEKRMTVTWSLPTSWKRQDTYYELIYELKYQPYTSSFSHEQIQMIKGEHSYTTSYTITDAMPGVKYLIQLRTKDEYDGQWSGWSTPVYASSWTAPVELSNDLTTTMQLPEEAEEGSGTNDIPTSDESVRSGEDDPVKMHHVLWISGSFVLLSVILAVYVFRHKERFMSKLHRLNIITQCGDSSQPQPSTPTSPEGQALMTFAPPHYREPRVSEGKEGEEENEEEHRVNGRIEAMHFNNSSYFLVQRE